MVTAHPSSLNNRTVLSARLVLAIALGLCLTGVARSSGAQALDDSSRAAARKLGYSGVEAFQAGDYKTAHDKLEKSYRVLQVPSVGLWSARALVKLGKLVEASERYLELSRLTVSSGDQAVQKQAQAEAATELEALGPKIPSLVVQIEGATAAEVKVTVDGTVISAELVNEARPVNPGQHRVEGARGSEQATAEVTLAEGEQKTAILRFGQAAALAPEPGAAPDQAPTTRAGLGTRRTLALVVGGVGLVGVGLGTYFGLQSKSRLDEADESCDGNNCSDPQGVTAGKDAYTAGNISTVGMVVGALGLAGGVVLWVTAPKSSQTEQPTPTAQARLQLGLGSVSLRGEF
jgi:hypothetical protein